MKECLVHFPSNMARPDMIVWENADGQLDEVVPESTASTRHAFTVIYSKAKGAPWNAWFHYLGELQPRPEIWDVYELDDDADPREFLTYLQN